MTKQSKNKKGFTIIEVVLVLAIAGLIFMMVFVALPALQRSQRDTQRSSDVQRLVAALNNYKSNNRGKIPTSGSSVTGSSISTSTSTSNTSSWDYFYKNYLLVGSAGQTDTFEDPDGESYNLQIVECGSSVSINSNCGTQINTSTFDSRNHQILIVTSAVCDGEVSKKSSGSRNFAALYKREGGGTICMAG